MISMAVIGRLVLYCVVIIVASDANSLDNNTSVTRWDCWAEAWAECWAECWCQSGGRDGGVDDASSKIDGIRGFISSDFDGQPIAHADLIVLGKAENVTSTIRGDYRRILLPGTYTVSASALGYAPSEHQRVTLKKGQTVIVNFVLKKL